MSTPSPQSWAASPAALIEQVDWQSVADDLDTHGSAVVEQLLTPAECCEVAALYDTPERFRSRIIMARGSAPFVL